MQVVLSDPVDEALLPESRCTELRGGCAFTVSFQLLPADAGEHNVIQAVMAGTECRVDGPGCLVVDANSTLRIMRGAFLARYEVLELAAASALGSDSGQCPNQWIAGEVKLASIPILNSSFAIPQHSCPTKFFAVIEGKGCSACPDMTTSDAGAVGPLACVPYNSVIIAGKS